MIKAIFIMRKQFMVYPIVALIAAMVFFLASAFDIQQEPVTETYYYQSSSTDPLEENNESNWTTVPSQEECVLSASILCAIVAPVGSGGYPSFDFDLGETVRNSPQITDIMFRARITGFLIPLPMV